MLLWGRFGLFWQTKEPQKSCKTPILHLSITESWFLEPFWLLWMQVRDQNRPLWATFLQIVGLELRRFHSCVHSFIAGCPAVPPPPRVLNGCWCRYGTSPPSPDPFVCLHVSFRSPSFRDVSVDPLGGGTGAVPVPPLSHTCSLMNGQQ